MSKLVFKDNNEAEFSVTHADNTGAISITSEELSKVKTVNILNIANGTLPTSAQIVSGQLWNNSGVVTVSGG